MTMSKLNLIDLPAEIRQIIYTELFLHDDQPLRVTNRGAIDKSNWPHPLLLTCHQIYNETLPFTKSNTIKLQCDNGMYPRTMKDKLPDHVSARIRVVHVARSAQAFMTLPVPSRVSYPALEEIIVEVEGIGRFHGHSNSGSKVMRNMNPSVYQTASGSSIISKAISWKLEGKPIEWLEAQSLIKHRMAGPLRRSSGGVNVSMNRGGGAGAWDRNARL